jgi:two-component system, chemotaxis family, sensor kinase CheA
VSFFSDEQAAELRALFFESAEEHLQAMNDAGLALEQQPRDAESLRQVRRAVHTLKGDSAACGFRELSDLAHELEDALTPELAAAKGGAVAELVFTAADTFHAMLVAQRGGFEPPSGTALREHIQRVLAGSKPAAQPASSRPARRFAWNDYETVRIEEALEQGETVFNISVDIDVAGSMRAASLQLVRNVLLEAGRVLAFRPELGTPPENVSEVEAALSTDRSAESLAETCQVPGIVRHVRVEPVSAQPDQTADPATHQTEDLRELLDLEATGFTEKLESKEIRNNKVAPLPVPASVVSENSLRVDAERIDDVLNLVGELIIAKSMLQRTILEFDRRYTRDPLRSKFGDALAFQSRLLEELQLAVMKIRMVPVDHLFRRLPRVARDISRQCGKEVSLEISGQHTDLDKGILDALVEPLIHIVRNSVDHGIESTPERIAAGKPPCGAIHLNAYHHSNQVVIEVTDDGQGINRERVVAKAVDRGLIREEEAAGLDEKRILDLIFEPGLSTARSVTEVSGRGVGMDVVRTVLARLKGTVSVTSRPGAGTTFQLRVPLTLASIKALMFRVAGRLYAVPLDSVLEITRASETDIHRVEDREILRLRQQVIALVRLHHLGIPSKPERAQRLFVLVVGATDRKFGLVVDSLMGEEELVIKALDDRLAQSELVSGASILGDGTVVLILNVPALVSRVSRRSPLGAIA